ncbi:N-acetyltransferase [Ruegeria sp. AD91A]|uniref:GNAT family N-acetyltransferase n=1 Tax=Ruegeria sp. AD91A TaxID=2293862 RepID=UPI000E4D69DE|nr:GNAT family N-acetyltransferase [Ruegeria sp. AD91A]AXT26227.1 N-acetyltransferase [Ruegeria sp. AD91A]
MSKIKFRTADVADADEVTRCLESAYADATSLIEDLPDVTAGIADDIKTHHVVLAISGGIVGAIVFDRVDDAIMVFNLAVSPEAQGQGVARRLMQFAEEEARLRKLSKLRLRTHKMMKGTIAMYLRMGWKVTAQAGNGLTMEKALGADPD